MLRNSKDIALKKLYDEINNELTPKISLVKCLVSYGFNHIDPIKFEELILKIFEVFGYIGNLTQRSGDEGIDILLTDPEGSTVIVQCKRFTELQNITPKEVREFVGSMVHAKAKYGYFITTTSFSNQAEEFCKNKEIILIDGLRLKKLFLLAVKVEINKEQYFAISKHFKIFIEENIDSVTL